MESLNCVARNLEACCVVRSATIPPLHVSARGSFVKQYRAMGEGLSCNLQRRCYHRAITARLRVLVPNASGGDSLAASLAETAALDQLIDLLFKCQKQERDASLDYVGAQLEKMVAENLLSFDQKFWVRLATRNDTAEQGDKARLSSLANTVMHTIEGIIKKTGEQLSESGRILQEILAAGADENGEWLLPLLPEQIQRMRQAINDRADLLDEALLSNAFAWMRKASDDAQTEAGVNRHAGMRAIQTLQGCLAGEAGVHATGMVALIQKVLQLYAARALVGAGGTDPGDAALNKVLSQEEQYWEGALKQAVEDGSMSPAAFQSALRRRMETIAFNLPSGSYAQRVQAEYLKELRLELRAFSSRLGRVKASAKPLSRIIQGI